MQESANSTCLVLALKASIITHHRVEQYYKLALRSALPIKGDSWFPSPFTSAGCVRSMNERLIELLCRGRTFSVADHAESRCSNLEITPVFLLACVVSLRCDGLDSTFTALHVAFNHNFFDFWFYARMIWFYVVVVVWFRPSCIFCFFFLNHFFLFCIFFGFYSFPFCCFMVASSVRFCGLSGNLK